MHWQSQVIAGAFDFSLYLPANMLLMALLTGAVTGWAAREARGRFLRLPGTRWVLPSLVAMLAVLNVWGRDRLVEITRSKRGGRSRRYCLGAT